MLKRNSDFMPADVYASYAGPQAFHNTDDFIDLKQLYKILRRRMQLIFVCVFFALCLGILYLIIATPKYSSNILILIDPREQKVLTSDSVVSNLGADSSAVESEVEILKSRAIAERVIRDLKLPNDDEFALFATLKSFVIKSLGLKIAEETNTSVEMEQRIEAFSRALTVKRKGLTYIIDVRYKSADPVKAAAVANAIGEAYLNEQLEAKFNITRRASVWLKAKLEELRGKVRNSERAVEAYKVQNNLVEADGKTLSEQQIAKLNAQLIDARTKTAGSFAKYKQARSMSERGDQLTSVADVLQSNVISSLRKQLAEVGRKEAELKSRYGPKHPTVINIQAEKRDITKQIGSEVSRIVANLKNEYEVSKSQEEALAASLEELKSQNSVKNSASIKLRELQRVAQAERAAFSALLNRFKETSAQETLQAADARIITTATPALKPSDPKKGFTLFVAAVIGLLFGVSVSFLAEYFDNVYRTVQDIEQSLGVPHLASIPMIEDEVNGKKARGGFFSFLTRPFRKSPSKAKGQYPKTGDSRHINRLVVHNPLSHYSEAIRSLRISTKLSHIGSTPKIIMMTSAIPNEGKTTTALNLALYSAMTGDRTLLIDADVRNPSLTKKVTINARGGLLNILDGSATFADVCITDKETKLNVLPNPNTVPLSQPSEILGSQPMAELIEELREAYDLIIVDVAPLLPVIDAQVLIPHIDKALLVVEWGQTSKDLIGSSVRSFQNYDKKLLGVVFNKTIQNQLKYYEGYGSGGYYSHYLHQG